MAGNYSVKEVFYTLQGEGYHTGRASVFCRFTGCNLWSGREQDRQASVCRFCDTDFVGTDGQQGGKFKTAQDLAEHIARFWPKHQKGNPFVVMTGGEPALQLDSALIDALHALNFEIAIETNGTLPLPKGIDWVCVSPKGRAELKVTQGDELKLVFPQAEDEAHPDRFASMDFTHHYIQPLDDYNQNQNSQKAVQFCLTHPQWKLSLQTHKILDID